MCPNPPPTLTHLHKKMRLDSLKDRSPGSSLTWSQGQPRGHHHSDGLAFVRGEACRLERQRGREAGSERRRGREAEKLALSSRSISRMAHCHSSQVSAWHPPTPGCRMQQRKVVAKIRGNAPSMKFLTSHPSNWGRRGWQPSGQRSRLIGFAYKRAASQRSWALLLPLCEAASPASSCLTT